MRVLCVDSCCNVRVLKKSWYYIVSYYIIITQYFMVLIIVPKESKIALRHVIWCTVNESIKINYHHENPRIINQQLNTGNSKYRQTLYYKASVCKYRLNIIGSRRGGNWENIYHGNEETTPREQTKSAAGPKLRGFKIDKAGVDRSRRFIRCNKYIVTLYIG